MILPNTQNPNSQKPISISTTLRVARLRRHFGLSETSARHLAAQVWGTRYVD